MHMPEVNINYLAVLIAAIVSMIVGGLWYSPILFGKMWTKAMGWNEETMKEKKGCD